MFPALLVMGHIRRALPRTENPCTRLTKNCYATRDQRRITMDFKSRHVGVVNRFMQLCAGMVLHPIRKHPYSLN